MIYLFEARRKQKKKQKQKKKKQKTYHGLLVSKNEKPKTFEKMKTLGKKGGRGEIDSFSLINKLLMVYDFCRQQ